MEAALTDDEILLAMASRPAIMWRRLFVLLGGLTEEGDQTTWAEPEHDHANLVLSYPVYSDLVGEICVLLEDLQVVAPFNWMSCDGLQRFAGGHALEDISAADVARLTTAIVRGERFRNGTIEQALQDDSFVIVLRRLHRWYEYERSTATPDRPEKP